LSGTSQDTRDPLAAWWRLTLVLLASVALPLALLAWIVVAWLWFGLREGENVVCHCWADNHQAWQYTGQFVLAWIGFIAGSVAAVMLLRRAWRLFPTTSTQRAWLMLGTTGVAVAALAGWIVFFVTGAAR
jgi:hypothetical protein